MSYIREKNGIDELHGYSVGMVLNDCGHDDSELIAMLLKKAMRDNNVNLWLFEFDVSSLISYSQSQERTQVARMFDRYIRDFILQKDFTPREYRYDPDYVMESQEYDESVKFYNCTKFEYFMNNPITRFRVPISYSYGDTNTLLRHPGNTRYMATAAMESNVRVQLLITEFQKNESLIQNAKMQSFSYENLATQSVEQITSLFDFSEFNGVSVRYSNQVGIQLVEPHSRLSEFHQSYHVKWTGDKMVVNDTVIAELHYNAKHEKGFIIMPGTKEEYLGIFNS